MLSELLIMVATINNKLTGLPNKKLFIATWREAAFFQICPSCLQEQANEIEGRGDSIASDMMYYTAMAHTGYLQLYLSRVPLY